MMSNDISNISSEVENLDEEDCKLREHFVGRPLYNKCCNYHQTPLCSRRKMKNGKNYPKKPHYSDLGSDLAFPGIRDLIWSNESVPILSPRDACSLQHNSSLPQILVMVPSGLVNFERRAAIRNSWGDTPLVREGKIKVIFVLGQKLGRLGASQVLC